MALDRPDDDLTRPERQVPGSDVPAARSDPAEWRSHEEYYEALRAADGRPPEGGGSRADRSGWNSVDAADRPPADWPPAEDIGVSPERTTHILDGDATGGGHRHGAGKPGKTEFPESWDDKYEIARRASNLPRRFADRIPRDTLETIELMDGGGEYGELTIELAASLAAHNTPVTPDERDELRALLEAMNMPTDPIEQLNVQP